MEKIIIFIKNIFHIIKYNFRNEIKIFIILLILVFLLTGVWFGINQYLKSTPEKTVRKFFNLFEDKNFSKMVNYMDPDSESQFKTAMTVLEQTITDVEVSNFKCKQEEMNGDKAKVKIEGDLKISFSHVKQEIKLDSIVDLVKKNNFWYLIKMPPVEGENK